MHTAFNSLRSHLERDPLAAGLRNVDTEDESHSCVFPSHICLAFLQLNVGISQFQDTSTINSKNVNEQLSGNSLVLLSLPVPVFINSGLLFIFYEWKLSNTYLNNIQLGLSITLLQNISPGLSLEVSFRHIHSSLQNRC